MKETPEGLTPSGVFCVINRAVMRFMFVVLLYTHRTGRPEKYEFLSKKI